MNNEGIYLLFLGHDCFDPKEDSQNRHSTSVHFLSWIMRDMKSTKIITELSQNPILSYYAERTIV